MRIYATFYGFENSKKNFNKFKWKNLVSEIGNTTKKLVTSKNNYLFKNINLKFGDRYMIECGSIYKNNIIEMNNIVKVNKNPRCNIIRKYKNEFHFINGKYKGKSDFEIPKNDLVKYCLWVCKNTINEKTVKNMLEILNKYCIMLF